MKMIILAKNEFLSLTSLIIPAIIRVDFYINQLFN